MDGVVWLAKLDPISTHRFLDNEVSAHLEALEGRDDGVIPALTKLLLSAVLELELSATMWAYRFASYDGIDELCGVISSERLATIQTPHAIAVLVSSSLEAVLECPLLLFLGYRGELVAQLDNVSLVCAGRFHS